MSEVRTRIAPSPTGGLHIGHMRTILFDYALAKKSGGKFVIRIEDTDQNRYVEGAVDKLLDVITDYGITWDEGPRVGGEYAPYVQSERLDLYKKYAEQLVDQDDAYYCFMNEEETKALQEESRLANKKLRSPYRNSSKEEVEKLIAEGREYVIRLKVKEGEELQFEDAALGIVKFNTNEVDDQVLLKSDGFPTYHLAVVIDDYLMKITHVLRGNDWLPSTPKHILLYKAFGWDIPVICHLPNLKEKDSGKKLSKRYGAVFASQFLLMGYLPEALNNFLMLLGWSSPEARVHGEKERELFTLQEFTELFSLDRVQKTALVSFDRDKLKWFNQQYVKALESEVLADKFLNWIEKFFLKASIEDLNTVFLKDDITDAHIQNALKLVEVIRNEDKAELTKKLSLLKDRAINFWDILLSLGFFYNAPEYVNWNITQVESFQDKINLMLDKTKVIFENMDVDSKNWDQQKWVEGMKNISSEFGLKTGDSFMILRLATVGSPYSPPLFEALQILGRDEVLNRLNNSYN